MGLAEARGRLVDAVFAHIGEDSIWEGHSETVRVITRMQDEEFGHEIRIIGESLIFRVRRSQVPFPQIGEAVTTIADGASYRVMAAAKADRVGVWHVPMQPA